MGFLYRLDFASGKSYLGITRGTAEARYAGHSKNALRGSTALVHNAWRRWGAPKLVVLAELQDDLLAEVEQKAIAVFKSLVPNGYNLTTGGDVGFHWTQETIAKISAARKGKPLTDEHRRAIAEASRSYWRSVGGKHSDETREKMREAINKPEARAKMAVARAKTRSKKCTPEQRVRMRLAQLRIQERLPPPEQRANMQAMWAATRGKPKSLETRKRMSEARKRLMADPEARRIWLGRRQIGMSRKRQNIERRI